jgi:hypothetical protein
MREAMMAGLLFVSQSMLDAWSGQGRVDLRGEVMAVLTGAGRGRRYAVVPAVRFLKALGSADPHGLVGKVKTNHRLRELKAEHIGDSVLLGDVAYEVEPGFMARAITAAPRGGTPVPVPPARLPQGAQGMRLDAESLARLILEDLK